MQPRTSLSKFAKKKKVRIEVRKYIAQHVCEVSEHDAAERNGLHAFRQAGSLKQLTSIVLALALGVDLFRTPASRS